MTYGPKLTVIIATTIVLAAMMGGITYLRDNARTQDMQAAEVALESTARAVETLLSRQLLQVDSTLASLPGVLAAARITPAQQEDLAAVLGVLTSQHAALRDLMLVGADGNVIASARSLRRSPGVALADGPVAGQTAILGPVYNSVTGEWSLYMTRSLPAWNGVHAVAELRLAGLTRLLYEVGIGPGVELRLVRRNGQLIASIPHDELAMGEILADAPSAAHLDGKATVEPLPATDASSSPFALQVARVSIYPDIIAVLRQDSTSVLAEWERQWRQIGFVTSIFGLLTLAFASTLLIAIHQRTRRDAERQEAAGVLHDAIGAMADGFVMWDRDDRLVTCNDRFRDLYSFNAEELVPGRKFEDVAHGEVMANLPPPGSGETIVTIVTRMIERHRRAADFVERPLPDGRWVLINERRMSSGGIVGIHTDITPLKRAQDNLARANSRANKATQEALLQNAILVEQERRIRFLAHHDDLTGLPNRLSFKKQLIAAMQRIETEGSAVALLFLDLDRFKDVNDTLGHPVGDQLLAIAAARLQACIGSPGALSRLGGDEFALLITDPDQPRAAEELSQRIITEMSRPFLISGQSITVSASIGIAVATDDRTSADALLKNADLALYRAKASGRGTFSIFSDEMGDSLHQRLGLEADLRKAVAEDEFRLVYQPIYDLETNKATCYEALLRWHHPERGLISPDKFISLVEEMRLIGDVGKWVLRRACTDVRNLPGEPIIAVNVSPVQLGFDGFADAVREILAETGLPPQRLELEITETALLEKNRHTLSSLHELSEIGVRIVLDDFGTGYSSLSYLQACPFNKIKIDKSFVQQMLVRPECRAIVNAIAALARSLDMEATAEGVETQQQLDEVRRAGCTQAQGFLLGRPRALESNAGV